MSVNRRKFLAAAAGAAAAPLCRPALAETKKLRFAVGPLLPNPDDTKKAFGPVFAYLAK
jgi:phosphonate transport system substrate-binding protein